MGFLLQSFIHKLEEASGARRMRRVLAVAAVLFVATVYDLCDYRNFWTAEAMDAAQVARNLAEGRGYSTLFIRPLSLCLVSRQNEKEPGSLEPGKVADYGRLRTPHPDISNPPVYPVVLAALMKILPFDYKVSTTQRFWSRYGRFWRYQPDFIIAIVNQFLFVALVAVTFIWARRLFDGAVAWTTAALMFGTELLWRFSVSGLPTLLLMLIFMGLVWCLTLWEEARQAPRPRPAVLFALAATAGLLIGLGGLTRYAFAFLMIPALVFILVSADHRRGILALTALAAFAAVMAPWIARNYSVSGTPFGTSTYALLEGTDLFPGDRLQRSLSPDLRFDLSAVWDKWGANIRFLLPALFTSLGGGLIGGFFLAGLLVGFRNPTLRRIRHFLLLCLALLLVVEGFARARLSADSAQVDSGNLLVLLLPLVVSYGVSFFFVLLDQSALGMRSARLLSIGVFCLLACLPLVFALLPPWTNPVAYPPYYPPVIQQTASWMKDSELMMSDIPWAVAWYGDRQCVWLTLNATADPANPHSVDNFFTIGDVYQKPVNALYLTPKTLDSRFVSDWIRSGQQSWGEFIVNSVVRNEVPPDFPLRQMPSGYLPEQLFLSDWKRWR
jgi:hypothetical protein